jgi:hypothetical protein
MQNGTRIAITLELESPGAMLTGRVTGQNGETKDFTGWLGLVAAIDELIAGRCGIPTDSGGASRTAGNGLACFSAGPARETVRATKSTAEGDAP